MRATSRREAGEAAGVAAEEQARAGAEGRAGEDVDDRPAAGERQVEPRESADESAVTVEPRPAPERSVDLARRIAAIVDAKQGVDLVAIDVGGLVSYTDVLVIGTARNERLARAIYEDVRLQLKHQDGLLPARVEGERDAGWILVDYLDCVLHLFLPELRERYRLEHLWGEAPRIKLGSTEQVAAG
ncbi:MAG: ribosome silencing factor [Solirubrobacterales bacterium]|nr:ribosome silencing factor [Solirubrobacterales bacterium]